VHSHNHTLATHILSLSLSHTHSHTHSLTYINAQTCTHWEFPPVNEVDLVYAAGILFDHMTRSDLA